MTDRSRRSPRGRAVLVGAAVAFALAQLATSILLDYRWPQIRFPFFYLQLAKLDNAARRPDVLILGSSRTGHLIADDAVAATMRDLTGARDIACFNAYCLGGDAVVSARMLDKIVERGIRPRVALIEITPEEVCRRNGWLFNYHFGLLRWDDVPDWFMELVRSRNLRKFAAMRAVPTFYYRDQIRKQFGQRFLAWYEGETMTPFAAGPPSHASAADAAQWRSLIAEGLRHRTGSTIRTTNGDLRMVERWFLDYQVGGQAAAALERQLAVCRAHGIEPILYSPPLSSLHRAFYTPQIEAAFQETMAAMTHKYGCRYVDYRTLLADGCFIDHHHCDAECVLPFSRLIALEVLAPAWHAVRTGDEP